MLTVVLVNLIKVIRCPLGYGQSLVKSKKRVGRSGSVGDDMKDKDIYTDKTRIFTLVCLHQEKTLIEKGRIGTKVLNRHIVHTHEVKKENSLL